MKLSANGISGNYNLLPECCSLPSPELGALDESKPAKPALLSCGTGSHRNATKAGMPEAKSKVPDATGG
jgi:hypothetical protein